MTLQQLTYFLAAVEHGSFSAAAEALLMSQPSLSEQVRRLEAELGVPLFTRVGRGLAPTEAGETPGPPPRRPPRGGGGGAPPVGRRGARAAGWHRDVRDVGHGALLPGHGHGRRVPPPPPRR